jgi:hypothetical protein
MPIATIDAGLAALFAPDASFSPTFPKTLSFRPVPGHLPHLPNCGIAMHSRLQYLWIRMPSWPICPLPAYSRHVVAFRIQPAQGVWGNA